MKLKETYGRAKSRRRESEVERAVSSVIGIILMIAVTVVIAVVVAAVSYGLISVATTTPRAALILEGCVAGGKNITLIHYGGETIKNAFKDGRSADYQGWDALQVKINGKIFDISAGGLGEDIGLNGVFIGTTGQRADWKTKWAGASFETGDVLVLVLKKKLKSGDSVTLIFTPSDDLLQRVKVV
ncbi:hypothetical protein B6V00_01605 [ANME-1 cluster archaeon ex4572_4]|nr:MAG: hypothetical protein B6V00_01605 [ANME-1 cluster archaeon ex4572_4]